MKFKSNFKVTAPATIANLACGFDVLGVALKAPHDEILVKPIDKPGIHISSIIRNKTNIPLSIEENAAGKAAQVLLDYLKKEHGLAEHWGLDFQLVKNVPVGFGLGSSSASAAAGVMAVNTAFGSPLTKRELIPFAVQGEIVAESKFRINNIVPSLLGGLFFTRDHESFDYHRLPIIKGLHLVVIYPKQIRLLHKEVRNNLSQKISLDFGIQQSANLASFTHALYTSNLDLLSRALKDCFAEKHWAGLIPFFDTIKDAALSNKALGCSIAGTGSGIFAICKNSLDAENVAEAMQKIYTKNKIKHKTLISKIDLEGATIS